MLLDILVQSEVSMESVDGAGVGFGPKMAKLSIINTVILQL